MDLPTNVLLPGEQLLWSGRPQRFALDGTDWYRLAFGVVWVTLGLVFFAHGRLGFFPVVWAVGGLLIAWVPVALRQRALRRAVYAVTNWRVVVADRVSGATRTSAYLGALPPPVAQAGADGVGAVSFGGSGGFLDAMVSAANTRSAPIKFVAVPDAERVRDLIAQAQTRPPVAG